MVTATSGVLGCSTLVIPAEASTTAPFTMRARSPLLHSSPLHLGSSSRLCYLSSPRIFCALPSSRFSSSEPAESGIVSQSSAPQDSISIVACRSESIPSSPRTNQDRDDMVESDIDVRDDLVELGPKRLRDWASMNDEEFKREAAFIAANPSVEKHLLLPEHEWKDFCWRRGEFLEKAFRKVAAHYKGVDLVERLRVLRENAKVSSGILKVGANPTNPTRARSKDVAKANTKKKRSAQKLRA